MSDITYAVGVAFALDEIDSQRIKAKGKVPDETMAARIARSVWEEQNKEQSVAEHIAQVAPRPSRARRLLWNSGGLFLRGGQWLQERFCVEPACA